MDRMKNSGFYTLKLFVTPEEFDHVLDRFEQKQARFRLSNYERTVHNRTEVYEAYKRYYQYFIKPEKPDYHPSFVYSIALMLDGKMSGFFVRNEGVGFPYLRQWADDELPCILLSFPKGLQIDLKDEKGDYYIYEDIREHQPLTYAFYDEVTRYIKKETKPLRFLSYVIDELQEQKPAVRISKAAMDDLAGSWIFKKYELGWKVK